MSRKNALLRLGLIILGLTACSPSKKDSGSVKQPVGEQPDIEKPTSEQPSTEQPASEQPAVAQQPATLPPKAQPPVEQPPVMSVQEQADKFFEEHLKLSKQKACNEQGLFYENGAPECHQAKLVSWECSEASLRAKIPELGFDLSTLESLDEFLAQGLKVDQCGEDSDHNIYVMLIRKEIVGDQIEVAAVLFILDAEEIIISRDPTMPSEGNETPANDDETLSEDGDKPDPEIVI